jgi:hypothetical protein
MTVGPHAWIVMWSQTLVSDQVHGSRLGGGCIAPDFPCLVRMLAERRLNGAARYFELLEMTRYLPHLIPIFAMSGALVTRPVPSLNVAVT